MLKSIRVTIAGLFFVCITALFLDFTGTLHAWLGWMAKIQFLPAILALNGGIILFLVILTLLFGRVYCSVICPLGVFQDVVSWWSGRRKKKKYRFFYSFALSPLRYSVLWIFAVAVIGGFGSFVALLAPYSTYGRIVSNLLQPIYLWGNNLLAYFSERADNYMFYSVDVWMRGLPTMIAALAVLIVLVVLAWRNGRTYCNTICPVGTFLGVLSRYALFRPVINADKCNKCGLCSKKCKSSCIDSKNHAIDYSRCVACMNCLETCKRNAIRYELYKKSKSDKISTDKAHVSPKQINDARRAFLSVSTLMVATTVAKAQEKKVDGGLAVIENKQIPERALCIVPPGALSLRNFTNHCTGCQLCVSVCPSQVLRPSSSLMTLMQPEMSYERGYCRPECTKCSEVCPAGAIRPITRADKSSVQIGNATWIRKNCVPLVDGKECGNCARHCPTKAIEMIPSNPLDQNSIKIPAINTERCIGCGACENLCPARPFSAIYVEGHVMHRII